MPKTVILPRLFPVGLGALTLAATLDPTARALQQTGESRTALVTVADSRNRPIVDLGPDDFVITEGGKAREVLDARVADYPIALLVDTGGGARPIFDDIRRAVLRFVGRLGPRPLEVRALGDPPTVVAMFEDDRQALTARIESMSARPATDTLVLQGAAEEARTLKNGAGAFSAMVIVAGPSVDASHYAAEELLAPIVDCGAIVHAVMERSTPMVPLSSNTEIIRRLSEQTRGQFTTIYSAASYQIALDKLAERLSSEIMIEYLVPPGSTPTDVQVGVRLAGARARGLGVRPR